MKLTELFKSIADTIRNCNPQAEPKIKAIDFPEAIVRACEESEVTGYNIGLTEGKESMIDRSKVIEKTANGNPAVIIDASEIPHTVGVKVVNNRNLVDLDRAITPNFSQGLNKSINADGTINLRGTLSETYSYYDGYNDIFIPSGTTITISSYFDTNFSEACLGIVLRTKEGKILVQGNALKNGQSTTVTLTEDITNASMVWRLPGATKGSYIELNNIRCQVEIGSTATEYVPFVNVSGLSVAKYGKNLFDLDKGINRILSQGLTKSKNSDGTINLRGNIEQNYTYYEGYELLIPKGRTITISSYFDTTYDGACLGIVLYDTEGKVVIQGNALTNGKSTSITLANDIAKASVVWRLPNCPSGTYIEINNIKCQLEIGSVTEYEPYMKETYTTNSNGEFECESLSPNMTFVCDSIVDIKVNYRKSWGMQTEYNRFWNCITKNNTRTDYQRAFYNWTDEFIHPPFVIKPTNIQYCFFDMPNFRKLEKQFFDFSTVTMADSAFGNNLQLETIEDCGLPAINQSDLFIGDTKLETIELIRVNENCTFSSDNWASCKALKNIVFEGVIGQNINFRSSSLLTTKSLLSILKALSKDSTYANGKTVTFNSSSRAVIEADTACSEQLTQAISAGWTVAYA